MSAKVKSRAELREIVDKAKRDAKNVVFTNGCFDLLHRGHVHLLREAKALGDLLVVAVNSDRSVKEIKGPGRPILPEADRIALIAALEMVDFVTLFDEQDPYKIIAALRPNVLVKGGDWSADQIVGSNIVEQHGGKIAVIPYLKGFSTTEIIKRIRGES